MPLISSALKLDMVRTAVFLMKGRILNLLAENIGAKAVVQCRNIVWKSISIVQSLPAETLLFTSGNHRVTAPFSLLIRRPKNIDILTTHYLE